MKRTLSALCLLAVILTSCGTKPQEEKEQSETQTTYVSASMTESTASESTASETASQETTVTTVSETEPPAPLPDDTYKKLYRDYLSERLNSDDEEERFSEMCFDVFDLDSDGVPELLFAQNSAHYAGVMIFTVKDGEMINFTRTSENGEEYEFFGSNGQVEYYPENGYICSSYGGSDTNHNELFKIEDHELKRIMVSDYTLDSVQIGDDWELRYKYTINDEEVTVEEFHDSYSYFEGISVSLGQSFLLSDEMFDAVFTDKLGKEKAYELVLKREEGSYSGCYYCMYDIDQNGTDDLILRNGNIYTYDSGLKYLGSFYGSYREYEYGDYYRYTYYENETEYKWSEYTTDVSVSEDGTVIRVTDENSVLHSTIKDGIVGDIERYSEFDLTAGGKLYTVDYIPVNKSVYDEKMNALNRDDYVKLEFKAYDSSENETLSIGEKGTIGWLSAYREFINEKSGNEYGYFSLYDVTDDDIPEIFLSHFSGHTADVEVYTFNSGKVTPVKIDLGSPESENSPSFFTAWGNIFYSQSKKVFAYMDGYGGTENTYLYRVEGDTIRFFTHYSDNDTSDRSSDYPVWYMIDMKEVSKEDFISSVDEYNADDYISLGKTYVIDKGSSYWKDAEEFTDTDEYRSAEEVFGEIEETGSYVPYTDEPIGSVFYIYR